MIGPWSGGFAAGRKSLGGLSLWTPWSPCRVLTSLLGRGRGRPHCGQAAVQEVGTELARPKVVWTEPTPCRAVEFQDQALPPLVGFSLSTGSTGAGPSPRSGPQGFRPGTALFDLTPLCSPTRPDPQSASSVPTGGDVQAPGVPTRVAGLGRKVSQSR